MELSSKQIEQFNKDGYIIFPELFTSDEIDIFKNEVDRVSKIRSEMVCLLYTSPSPRDVRSSRMPSSA